MTDIINNFQEFYLKDDNWILKKIMIFCEYCTAWKVSKYGVISGPYFSVFRLNTENTAQKKIRIRTLFTQCWKQLWRYSLKHHVTIHLNLKIPILLHGVHKTPENNKAFLKPENVKDQSSSRFVNFLKIFFEKLTFLTPDAYTRTCA